MTTTTYERNDERNDEPTATFVPTVAPVQHLPPFIGPPDARRRAGRALRQTVRRASHAELPPLDTRPDAVEVLKASNAGRVAELVPIRIGRMAVSPFTYYRGAAAMMAHDLSGTPTTGLPVQACGDAHLQNFGVFATPDLSTERRTQLDRYRLVDAARKVVGVGSVGTHCSIGLFTGRGTEGDDPVFLQMKRRCPPCSRPASHRASTSTTDNGSSRASG